MTASRIVALALLWSFGAATAEAETGYDLWLRYAAVTDSTQLRTYRRQAATLVCGGGSATARATRAELQRGLAGLLGRGVPVAETVTADGAVVMPRTPLLAELQITHESLVDYTMPLGLHHMIGGDHYAPMPENTDPRRADWSATTYHQASATGLGYDRTRRGSAAVDQYAPALREAWGDPRSCPEQLLLWFHRVPWDHKLRSGRTLWEELGVRYRAGAAAARALETRWQELSGRVDDERHRAVGLKLRQQTEDAAAWRDKILRYFRSINLLPETSARPE